MVTVRHRHRLDKQSKQDAPAVYKWTKKIKLTKEKYMYDWL